MPASARTIVWLETAQAAMVRRIADRAHLDIVAAGGPDRGGPGSCAQELGVEPVGDLRAVLASSQADLIWIAAPGEFGIDPDGADTAALLSAASRSVTVATLEPIPASALMLASGRWQRAEHGRTPIETIRVLPLMRHGRAMREGVEVLEQLGRPRTCAIQAWCRPEQGSLGARLFSALDQIVALMGEPESVDAAYAWPGTSPSLHALPSETLADLQGDLTCNLRFADGRAACIAASNQAGRWSHRLTVIAQQGRLEIDDASFLWYAPDGAQSDAWHEDEAEGSLGERVIARALAQLVDSAMPKPAPCDVAGILAVAQAALLSARTGQTESPATIRQIVALA